MSLFRIGGASGLRVTRLAVPVNVRFISKGSKGTPVKTDPSEAPTATHSSSSLVRKQGPAEAMTHHQPDYDATIDHGTSYAIPCQPPSQILSANPDNSFQDLLPGPQACDGWQRARRDSSSCRSLRGPYRPPGPNCPVCWQPRVAIAKNRPRSTFL